MLVISELNPEVVEALKDYFGGDAEVISSTSIRIKDPNPLEALGGFMHSDWVREDYTYRHRLALTVLRKVKRQLQ